MLTLESLTRYSNVLELTNRHHFLNTTTVSGACYTPNNCCSKAPGISRAVMVDVQPSYFSGYVFRGDTRPPDLIFERGFELQQTPGDELTTQRKMIGAVRDGFTDNYGISTSVCASVSAQYAFEFALRGGYVYLIDATVFKGFAIPAPLFLRRSLLVMSNPILKDIYEVNFPSNIPGSYIVGIVWSLGGRSEGFGGSGGLKNCRRKWPYNVTRLWLAVNPNFRKPLLLSDGIMEGMEAAKQVQAHFNERHISHLLGLEAESEQASPDQPGQ